MPQKEKLESALVGFNQAPQGPISLDKGQQFLISDLIDHARAAVPDLPEDIRNELADVSPESVRGNVKALRQYRAALPDATTGSDQFTRVDRVLIPLMSYERSFLSPMDPTEEEMCVPPEGYDGMLSDIKPEELPTK